MPKGKGYPKANPVPKGKTRITMNPGKKNETSVEFKRSTPPSSGDVGSGLAGKAAKAKEKHKKRLKKAGR